MIRFRIVLLVLSALLLPFTPAFGQKTPQTPFIPRRQSQPPGPPVSPEKAIEKMDVPPGFSVELVASEPQLVNPVAMCFDEKGRIWVTESLEYPRRRAGIGRDRVKVLEDTDGDGKVDKTTVVIEGLNIPSGINVGYGGVWVANAPDILFYPFRDRDTPTLGKPQVVVTGFGRTDTHELPNSLTWGPDGWLYGLNGVFNHSHVRYAKTNSNYDEKHPGWKFTCAMFRIHPRTRKFEVFAEGTSNPWGIAFNRDGEAFISACVIDHLWHITETGYYHRQGGPYPPHTWKIGSIVEHKHQKAAYCGIHYYDSHAYPEEYRGHLYMGNIHGGCINVDTLQRDGSTYLAKPRPDFLTANDVWFMPVAQKTGPDGCLYVLDWYDRYHCYQDANADPKGVDRLHGRLYRIRYKNTPRAKSFDLSKETDEQLIQRLRGGNGLLRRLARRTLTERNNAETKAKLRKLVFDDKAKRITQLNALWVLIGAETLHQPLHRQLLKHDDPTFRAWGVRAAANVRFRTSDLREAIAKLAKDESPIVRREVAIASSKIAGPRAVDVLTDVLAHSGDDKLLPHIVWNNLKPRLKQRHHAVAFLKRLLSVDFSKNAGAAKMMPYVAELLVDRKEFDAELVSRLLDNLRNQSNPHAATAVNRVIALIAGRVQNGEIAGEELDALQASLQPFFHAVAKQTAKGTDRFSVMQLAASLRNTAALQFMQRVVVDVEQSDNRRLAAARALIAATNGEPGASATGEGSFLKTIDDVLRNPKANSADFRGKLLAELGRLKGDKVADVVLKNYGKLEPDLKPRAIELLTQRVNWSKKLLAVIGRKKIPAKVINLNQARRLLAFKNADLTKLVKQHWGIVRTTRDPERAKYVAKWKRFLRNNPGDPFKGAKHFKKVCAQCHKMYGEGADVGPDITRNGRNSFDQLLSNVFDPSLVIGSAYRAHTVATKDGRVITGLVVENTPQRIVLKVQGGKKETIARDSIEFSKESKVSMMPEDIEKQLKPQQIADLFAYLTLNRPPSDPNARQLPGVREIRPRQTTDPKQYGELIAQVLPGFTTSASGERGVGLLKEYRGRRGVIRTHPVNRKTPCVLKGTFQLPEKGKPRLLLAVAHHRRGDWKLIVKANGETLLETVIGPKTTEDGWTELSVDLSNLAGEKVRLELHNHPTGWAWEYGYWRRAEVVTH